MGKDHLGKHWNHPDGAPIDLRVWGAEPRVLSRLEPCTDFWYGPFF